MGTCDTTEEITYFLQILDPFNTQNITFSEIVQLFSSHQVSYDDTDELESENDKSKKMTLIEKFSKTNRLHI